MIGVVKSEISIGGLQMDKEVVRLAQKEGLLDIPWVVMGILSLQDIVRATRQLFPEVSANNIRLENTGTHLRIRLRDP